MTLGASVDLSRLTAPDIVETIGFAAIRDAILADFAARLPDFDLPLPADPIYILAEASAFREVLIRQNFNDAARQLMVAYATGAALDHLAALVGVARLEIVAATADAPAVYESDDSLRQRVVLAPEGFSVAGPALAYVKHAKDASGDVLDASATSPAPGEVLVTVLSVIGDGVASDALLDLVRDAVTDDAVRPLGDDVTVRSAEISWFQVTASLTTFSGPDISVVLASARVALNAYLTEAFKLDRNVTRAGIIAALMVEGVENVALASPAADVNCGATQAPRSSAVTLVHGGYAE